MKNFILFALVMMFSLSLNAQNDIPNAGFEKWDSITYYSLKDWDMSMGNINPVKPAHTGNWACKIQNGSLYDSPGVVMVGKTNDGQVFWGGKPFKQKPDSIKMYIKYNIEYLDTARLLIIFKREGNFISIPQTEALAYGSHTSGFQEFKCKILYDGIVEPDTIIFGIVSSDYISHPDGPWPVSNYLIVDDVTFIKNSGIALQIPNNGFEEWDSTQVMNPKGWYKSNDPRYIALGLKNPIERSTDASEGKYALLLQNYLSATDTTRGVTFTPSPYSEPWENKPAFKLTQPFNYNTFSFDYKFFPENKDTMLIMLGLYEGGNYIGNAFFRGGSTVSKWTNIELPININPLSNPDSAKIYIFSYKNENDDGPMGNSILLIDNLSFSLNTSIPVFNTEDYQLTLFPNPICDKSSINFQLLTEEKVEIRIIDATGKEVMLLCNNKLPLGNHNIQFDGSKLPNGIYYCVFTTGKYSQLRKIVIER